MKSTIFLACLFVFLQLQIWLGSEGIFYLKALNQLVTLQNCKNAELNKSNNRLAAEIQLLSQTPDLQAAPARIEDYARWELGMIKSGEILYEW